MVGLNIFKTIKVMMENRKLKKQIEFVRAYNRTLSDKISDLKMTHGPFIHAEMAKELEVLKSRFDALLIDHEKLENERFNVKELTINNNELLRLYNNPDVLIERSFQLLDQESIVKKTPKSDNV